MASHRYLFFGKLAKSRVFDFSEETAWHHMHRYDRIKNQGGH